MISWGAVSLACLCAASTTVLSIASKTAGYLAQKRGAPSLARSRQSAARSGGAGQRREAGSRPVSGDEEELDDELLLPAPPPPLIVIEAASHVVSAARAESSGSSPEESAARQARSPLAPSSRAAWASAPETLDLRERERVGEGVG